MLNLQHRRPTELALPVQLHISAAAAPPVAMNKRQTARNERALQDLLKVPGNDRCADCFARNPGLLRRDARSARLHFADTPAAGWASWNLGVFLCVRCASLHRKLGTHISKVKSLSMDAWTIDQVDVGDPPRPLLSECLADFASRT